MQPIANTSMIKSMQILPFRLAVVAGIVASVLGYIMVIRWLSDSVTGSFAKQICDKSSLEILHICKRKNVIHFYQYYERKKCSILITIEDL